MSHLLNSDDFDPGHDLEITNIKRRNLSSGTWVSGRISGHRFQALVFQDHARNKHDELGESRISKLWLQRLTDGATVYNWDRGPDIPAATDDVLRIVDFLAAGLADLVYG